MTIYRLYTPDEADRDGYPVEWHKTIKHAVREEAGHRCVLLGFNLLFAAIVNVRAIFTAAAAILIAGMAKPVSERFHFSSAVFAWLRGGGAVDSVAKEYRKPSVHFHVATSAKNCDIFPHVISGVIVFVMTVGRWFATPLTLGELESPCGTLSLCLRSSGIAFPARISWSAQCSLSATVGTVRPVSACSTSIDLASFADRGWKAVSGLVLFPAILTCVHGGILYQRCHFIASTILGEELTREETTARLDELLELGRDVG